MKEGWTYKKLGEVARVQNGFAFDSKLFNEQGQGTPLIRIRDIKRGFTNTYTMESCSEDYHISDGDILIGMDGDFNVCSWKGGHSYLNQRVCHVIPVTGILPRYLLYLLPFPLLKINKRTTFATVKHLSSKQVNDINLPIPSLDEQQRIVSRLDSAFAHIDELKANAEKQLSEARILFQKSLTQAMTPKEGWEEKKLGDSVVLITDGDHQPPPKSRVGIPFITISNINKENYIIDFSDTFFVPEEYYDSLQESKKPQNNDVLYTVTGSFGIPVLVRDDKKFCFQRHIALIRPKEELLCSHYIFYWVLSDFAKQQAEDTATGAAQRTVSLNSLRNFTICFPPLSEQQRIVSRLDALSAHVRELEGVNRKNISECDALKQALLRKVFE